MSYIFNLALMVGVERLHSTQPNSINFKGNKQFHIICIGKFSYKHSASGLSNMRSQSAQLASTTLTLVICDKSGLTELTRKQCLCQLQINLCQSVTLGVIFWQKCSLIFRFMFQCLYCIWLKILITVFAISVRQAVYTSKCHMLKHHVNVEKFDISR